MAGESSDGKKPGFHEAFREAGPYLTLGVQLALTMVVWSAVGYLLDRWLETLPWLTLVGALVGMISVFVLLFRLAADANRKQPPKR